MFNLEEEKCGISNFQVSLMKTELNECSFKIKQNSNFKMPKT